MALLRMLSISVRLRLLVLETFLTYLARRLQTLFQLSTHWKSYDIFSRQKMATFRSSRAAVVELAAQYKILVTELEGDKTLKNAKTPEELEKAEEAVFIDMHPIYPALPASPCD